MDRRQTSVRKLPAGDDLLKDLPFATYVDRYGVSSDGANRSIVDVFASLRQPLPLFIKALMLLRTIMLAPLQIKGPGWRQMSTPIDRKRAYRVGDTIGGWRIYRLDDHEIVTGLDDWHLKFRVSLRRLRHQSGGLVTFSTAVQTLNMFGRLYLAVILPFHRIVVRSLLSGAAKAGRI